MKGLVLDGQPMLVSTILLILILAWGAVWFLSGFHIHDAAEDALPYCQKCHNEGMSFGKYNWACDDREYPNAAWIAPNDSCEGNMAHVFGEASANYLEWYDSGRIMRWDAYVQD